MTSPMTAMLDLTPANLLEKTSLPFVDARECKLWLATLPLTDIPQAHAIMLETIESLNLTELPGFERLKIMELMRDKVSFLQDSIAEVFAGRSLPLSNTRSDIWERAQSLWHGMEKGYRYCLRKAANNDEETVKHIALIVERCMRYLGLQLHHHGFVYREIPHRIMHHLHALLHFAEKRGVAHLPVKDSLDGHRGMTTAAQIYIRALLIDAARPSMLLPTELLAVDSLLKRWSSKVVISRIPPENFPATLRCTDLAGEKGLWAPSSIANEGDRLIFLDLKEISESLRRRLKKLHAGTPWNELGLPAEFAKVSTVHLLHHLQQYWCDPLPAVMSSQVLRESYEVAVGFSAIYHCLAHKPFEAPRHTDEMGSAEVQQMMVFGKIIHRVASDAIGESSPAETWKLEHMIESSLILRRLPTANISVGLQQLICYRKENTSQYQMGVITGLIDNGTAGIAVEVLPMSGQPDPVIIRSKESAFAPAVRTYAEDKKTIFGLLIPTGSYNQGKVIEVRTNLVVLYKLTTLIQRGTNFDYVNCEAI